MGSEPQLPCNKKAICGGMLTAAHQRRHSVGNTRGVTGLAQEKNATAQISFRYQKEGTPLPLNCDETARDLEVPNPSADQRPLKTSDHAVDRFPYQRPHTIPTADPHVSSIFSIL
jgi:hypothetical protein